MAVATQEAGTGTKGSAADASAYLQRESRRFASLYEANAYVAYNLALRITCEERAARTATERAFLMRLGKDEAPTELALAVVAAARAEARDHPVPTGAGDAEAEQLLAAIATLPPAERVAIGLVSVDHGTPTKVGAALDLPPEAAGKLRTRAQQGFAAALGASAAEAKKRSMHWPWAQPPPEMWEALYADAYRALERGLSMNGGSGEPVAVAGAVQREAPLPPPAAAVSRSWRNVAGTIFTERSLRTLFVGRPRWMSRAALGAAICLPAALAAMVVFGGGGDEQPGFNLNGTPAGGAAAAGAPGADGKAYKPLTPQELDKLRLNELKQLREYSKQQQNRSLSLDERRSAAERAARLADTARQRLSAARAERRRRAAARPRRRPRRRVQNVAPAPAPTKPSSGGGDSGGGGSTDGGGGGTTKPDYSKCLFDENSGSYVCPT